MLCDACQRKDACIPQRFAQQDQTLRQMLGNLKQCEMRVESAPIPMPRLKVLALKVRRAFIRMSSLHIPLNG